MQEPLQSRRVEIVAEILDARSRGLEGQGVCRLS